MATDTELVAGLGEEGRTGLLPTCAVSSLRGRWPAVLTRQFHTRSYCEDITLLLPPVAQMGDWTASAKAPTIGSNQGETDDRSNDKTSTRNMARYLPDHPSETRVQDVGGSLLVLSHTADDAARASIRWTGSLPFGEYRLRHLGRRGRPVRACNQERKRCQFLCRRRRKSPIAVYTCFNPNHGIVRWTLAGSFQ